MQNIFLDDSTAFSIFVQIAQVHRATLRDGQDVVVKVQHEGIKEVILEVVLGSQDCFVYDAHDINVLNYLFL